MDVPFSPARLRSVLFIFLCGLVLCFPVFAQEFRLRAAPEVVLPLADRDAFGVGGGASLVVDLSLLGFLAPYAGADIRFVSPAVRELDSSLMLTSIGVGLGVFAYPMPRLKLGASVGPGFYTGTYRTTTDTVMTGNMLWRVGMEAGYRVSPGLTISAATSYVDYRTQFGSFFQGLTISLLADIGFRSRTAEGRVVLQSAQTDPVFPVIASDYQTVPFGTVTIRNAESAEIRNVEIWFYADGYTSGPVLGARIPFLPKNATAEAPVFAAFSDRVMTVTDTVRISGEVRVIYELLGDRRMATSETTIAVMHRNAFTWSDPAILASFVSPNDPAVLDATKFIAGVVRSNTRPELDANFQYALGIFEGFRISGIAWAPDPQTPYAGMRADTDAVDYVQYPHQTIAYRSGDSDDLAVLYAAALESIGIPAAMIPLADEVLVAFQMSSSEAATRSMFSNIDSFVYVDGEAWVPLRISMLREGFLRAWSEGARIVRTEAPVTGTVPTEFFRLSDAWRRFAPAGVPGISSVTTKPSENQILTAFNSLVSLVVAREVGPTAERMRASFGPTGGTGRQRNALGVLFARYGMYPQALAEFQAAAALGEQRAGINIGNVAFLMRDFDTAIAWYQRAMSELPQQVAPVIGLARSYYELDLYEQADEYFRRAAELTPEVVDRYSYLSARLPGTEVRASAAMDRIGDMMWDE